MNNVSPLKQPGKQSSVGTPENVDNNNEAELRALLIATLTGLRDEKQHAPQATGKKSVGVDEVDLREVFAILLHSKWLIVAITALALLAGLFYANVSTPLYSADALVRIEKKKGLAETMEQLGEMLEGELPVEDEIEILRSRMILEQVVNNLDKAIIVEPLFYPLIGKAIVRRYSSDDALAEPWFGADEYVWGGEQIKVQSLDVPSKLLDRTWILVAGQPGHYQLLREDGQKLLEGQVNQAVMAANQLKLHIASLNARPGTRFKLTKTTPLAAIESIEKRLTVASKGQNSNILTLKLTSSNQNEAATTLNEIIKIYLQQNVAHMSEEASQTLAFLETQIPQEKIRVDEAVKQLNAYRLKQGSVDLSFETEGVLDNIIAVKTKKQELEREREELRSRFTVSHPRVQSIDGQIRLLNAEIVKMNAQVGSLPDTQQTVLRLNENVELKKKLYSSLVNSAQELRMAKAGTVGNVRVIDYAVPPKLPFAPKKLLSIIVATILGLIFAITWVFVRQALKKRGVEDPRLIEDQLGMPVYASIPHSDEQEKHEKAQLRGTGKAKVRSYGLLALDYPKDPAIEGLMSLGTRLHFAQKKKSNKIILISGPSPGVGKSFISANLSAALASQGKKILLIDSDIRRGHLNRYFDQPRERGLSEYLSGRLELKSAIRKTRCPDVYLIPTGDLPPNPVELLMDERFSSALYRLNQVFDHIIIDSSPILAVTDASIVARLAGITLLVAKSGAHDMSELEQCIDKFKHEDINLRGVILNDVSVIENYGYSYGKYVYQYNYGGKSD